MKDQIINRHGYVATMTGKGVEAFRLRAIWAGLKFKMNVGVDLDRRFPIVKIAKAETGLRTNKIPVLMDAIAAKMNAVIAQCEVIDDTPAAD